MKKIKMLVLCVLIFMFFNPLFVRAEAAMEYGTYNDAVKMVQEVMKSYYIRGPYLQYNYAKAMYKNLEPEEATSQDNKYTVCAGYTHNVYNQAFGMLGGSYLMSGENKFNTNLFPQYNYHIIMAAQSAFQRIRDGKISNDGSLLLYYQSNVNTVDKTESSAKTNRDRDREFVKFLYDGNDNTPDIDYGDITYDKDGNPIVKFDNEGDFETLVQMVQPGDLVVYSGHALIIYDTVDKNNDGKKDDIIILNATGSYEIYSKISSTSSLYYDIFKSTRNGGSNPLLNVDAEGTVKWIYYSGSDYLANNDDPDNIILDCSKNECAVIRPFYNKKGKAVFNYGINEKAYKETQLRTSYPGLHIEKTVDVGDNNNVYVGDELTYTIKITNKSNVVTGVEKNYGSFYIQEYFDDNVKYDPNHKNNKNNGGKVQVTCVGDECKETDIIWQVNSLGAGTSIELKYTVTVDNNVEYVGETVSSTGSFYSSNDNIGLITTGTVENKIIPKVTKYFNSYSNCYSSFVPENNDDKVNVNDKYKGLNLIDEIYKCALGKDYDFGNFKFNNLLTKAGSSKTNGTLAFNDNLDATYSNFKSMILNNYFNGLARHEITKNSDDGTTTTTYATYLPRWNSTNNEKALRSKNINVDGFKDGDVLIYYVHPVYDSYNGKDAMITAHPAMADLKKLGDYTKEDNMYAFIYVDGQFKGINNPGAYNQRHLFTPAYYGYNDNGMSKDGNLYKSWSKTLKKYRISELSTSEQTKVYNYVNYQSLFGKDWFIILRPELIIKEAIDVNLTAPTKKNYIQKYEDLDLTGGILKVTYNDGSVSEISLDDEAVKVSGFDNSIIGTKTISVTYEENVMTFDVEIISKQINNVELKELPAKTTYIQNYESLDLTGGILKVTYNDNTTDDMSLTNENIMVTGFDNSTVGKKTLTVEYEGRTFTFDVEIVSKQVNEIEVIELPTKTTYIKNYEDLDLSGGVIKITYNDESVDEMSLNYENVKISGFDNSTVGKKLITVEYNGHTATFEVEVISKELTKIEITTKPTKVNYIQNYEDLDLTGGILEVTYDDNTTSEVSLINENIMVTGFDNSIVGKKILTVEYDGHTTTFEIEIISKQLTKIEITTKPTKVNYIQNYEDLDLTGGILKVTYNDNTTSEISLTNESIKVTGFDNSTVGKKTLTVEYEGNTTTFEVEIISKQSIKIEITTKPTKVKYIQNYEDLDLTGGLLKVTYNNKTSSEVSMTNESVKVTGFDNRTVGKKLITVEYDGHTATFDVEIISKKVKKIEITVKPSKTNYIQNYENLDLTGGVLKVTYNDNTTSEVSLTNENVMVSGFDNSVIGKNTITVEYNRCTTELEIEIISKQAVKIEVVKVPTKTEYGKEQGSLDLTNGIIMVIYNDNTTDEISMTNENIKVTGFNNSTIGMNTITIEYEGHTTTFDVEIVEGEVIDNPKTGLSIIVIIGVLVVSAIGAALSYRYFMKKRKG